MVIINGLVWGEDGRFSPADVAWEGERITRVAPAGSLPAWDAIDAGGGYVLPGFVDIHTHGCMGSDLCDADPAGLVRMLDYYGRHGVTSVVPATMSYDTPILAGVMKAALPVFEKDGYGAVLRGIHMEGPFLNPGKAGAQNSAYITCPQPAMFDELFDLSGGRIRLVDVAPELPGSLDFIRYAARRCAVSIAHTAANYNQACAAFDAGASHVTHLFNAMPPFAHREPGVIGAAFDKARYVEVIADGVHLHPAVVRSVFRWFGEERVCLVSDSMRGAGLPDGEYDLGGQTVRMERGKATLAETGAIAGSTANLAECCRRAVRFGVPVGQAVRAATLNPARAVGQDHMVGSLAPGKRADIVIWNADLQTREVVIGGRRLPR